MAEIDLGEPRPRPAPLPYVPAKVVTGDPELLPWPVEIPRADLFEVASRRRSSRMLAELPISTLSALLWHSRKLRNTKARLPGSPWMEAATPSGGGCHPIDILLLGRNLGSGPSLYDPVAHALLPLAEVRAVVFTGLVAVGADCFPSCSEATFLWFAARIARTASHYENPGSLILRDSGALLGVLSLCAEALGVGLCGLGPTGEPYISALMSHTHVGVGGCVVGCRRD